MLKFNEYIITNNISKIAYIDRVDISSKHRNKGYCSKLLIPTITNLLDKGYKFILIDNQANTYIAACMCYINAGLQNNLHVFMINSETDVCDPIQIVDNENSSVMQSPSWARRLNWNIENRTNKCKELSSSEDIKSGCNYRTYVIIDDTSESSESSLHPKAIGGFISGKKSKNI